MNKQYILIGAVVVVLIGVVWFFTSDYGSGLLDGNKPEITYNNADKDMIVIDNIPPGVTVLREFTVFGQARGQWFFEASFPVEVRSSDGRTIAMGHAEAQGEWMTEEFVPFVAEVKLQEIYKGAATLILHKDNPSGESSRDASVEIPIVVQDY